MYQIKSFLPTLLATSLSCALLTACGVDDKPSLPTASNSGQNSATTTKSIEFAVFPTSLSQTSSPRAENGELSFDISILNANTVLTDDTAYTVSYSVAGIDAILADSSQKSGTVILSKKDIASGSTELKKTVTLKLKSDGQATPDLQAVVSLSNASTGSGISALSGTSTISISNIDVGVGIASTSAIKSTGDSNIRFTIATEPNTNVEKDTKVFFEVVDVSAKAGTNYIKPTNNFVTIKAGESSANLDITLIGEPPSNTLTFKVVLTSDTQDILLFSSKKEAVGSISSYVPEKAKRTVLNDTGVAFAGNTLGNLTDCTGDMPTNQDCNHGRDKTAKDDSDGVAGFSFTKLDSSGNPLSATATEWACIQDNVTGLIWETKTYTPKVEGKWGAEAVVNKGVRDAEWQYTYYDSKTGAGFKDTGTDGKNKEDCGASNNICTTEQYALTVNDSKLCGLSNWRLPTRTEMLGIANLGHTDKGIVFHAGWLYPSKDAIPSSLWTSSPAVSTGSRATYTFDNIWQIYTGGSFNKENPTSEYSYASVILVSNGK